MGGCARCGKVIGENCRTLVGECLVGDAMLAAFEPLVCDYTHSVTFLGMIEISESFLGNRTPS